MVQFKEVLNGINTIFIAYKIGISTYGS